MGKRERGGGVRGTRPHCHCQGRWQTMATKRRIVFICQRFLADQIRRGSAALFDLLVCFDLDCLAFVGLCLCIYNSYLFVRYKRNVKYNMVRQSEV